MQDEEVTFNLFEAMKHYNDKGAYFKVDAMEESIWNVSIEVHILTPLERTLNNFIQVFDVREEKELEECVKELEALEEIQPWEE